jgi:alcohol dehydrogenase class IV
LSLIPSAIRQGADQAVTADGALDSISHSLEALYSAMGKPNYDRAAAVARGGIGLVINYLPLVLADPQDAVAWEALASATWASSGR